MTARDRCGFLRSTLAATAFAGTSVNLIGRSRIGVSRIPRCRLEVLIVRDERTRLLLRLSDYDGSFHYHCHMLEHEDSGLMRNYLARA